ncbi:MAG: carboxypeptidase regulatory-like domain-containing protein [Polyangiaceae bacterium]|nr:carboxypeptidase regulatory-like domain-containing protein [Polyangiaceae bacterium]
MASWSIKAGLLVGVVAFAPGMIAGCSCGDGGDNQGAGASGGGTGTGGQGGELFTTSTSTGCTGLECQQVACSNGAKTTVTGRVYEPAGKVPLYNVVAYVPNAPVNEITDGATCDQCGSSLSGSPIVTALTDTEGRFVLEDVPAGDNIPLVIQIGKWRREFVLPHVEECVENPTTDGDFRLPRNKSEGHIPKIALTTGGADPLECLLRKLGLDDEEFTNRDGDGRVNLFAGPGGTSQYVNGLNNGADFDPATSLWGTLDSLMDYDIVLLACEADQHAEQKPPGALGAMLEYTSNGGRVFASHWHNYWLQHGPDPFPTVATWEFNDDPTDDPFIGTIDQSFPKGQALADWLVNVQASTTLGELVIVQPQDTVASINSATTRRWIYSQAPISEGIQYFSFNTPVGVPDDQQCGRMVYSDIHVSSGDLVGPAFPSECQTQDLSPQEKALLFMLFDLSACIIPDDDPPEPPPPD